MWGRCSHLNRGEQGAAPGRGRMEAFSGFEPLERPRPGELHVRRYWPIRGSEARPMTMIPAYGRWCLLLALVTSWGSVRAEERPRPGVDFNPPTDFAEKA